MVCGGSNLSFGLDEHLDLGENFRIWAMVSQSSEQWFDHLQVEWTRKTYIFLKVWLVRQTGKQVSRRSVTNHFFYSSPKSVANRCYTNPKGAAYSNGCWTKCAFGAIKGVQ